ncbi:MAG: pyrroline-5-carboxylate reductase [Candidatus Altiarchaeota archaeon]
MKVAFIGVGRMGGTLLKCLIDHDLLAASDVCAYDLDEKRLQELPGGVVKARTAGDAVSQSDILFLCVKPKDVGALLDDIGERCSGKLIVSIAAGISTGFIEKYCPGSRVIRVMPNTPALVGEMAAAYSTGSRAGQEDSQLVERLLKSLGVIVKVEESLMDAVTGLSGSGPAYVYYVIKHLAEGGVAEGMDEETALQLAVKTVKGAAVMVEETGMSPDELIGMVKSPGGTTVEGLKTLDECGVGEALRKAVSKASKKSKELGK